MKSLKQIEKEVSKIEKILNEQLSHLDESNDPNIFKKKDLLTQLIKLNKITMLIRDKISNIPNESPANLEIVKTYKKSELAAFIGISCHQLYALINKAFIPQPDLEIGCYGRYSEEMVHKAKEIYDNIEEINIKEISDVKKRNDSLKTLRQKNGFFTLKELANSSGVSRTTITYHIDNGHFDGPKFSLHSYHGLYLSQEDFDKALKYLNDRKDGNKRKSGPPRTRLNQSVSLSETK